MSPEVRSLARIRSGRWVGGIRRYLPLELVGIGAAYAGNDWARRTGMGEVGMAYATAWSESVAFFGFAVLRDVWAIRQIRRRAGQSVTLRDFGFALWELGLEFGPSELGDALFFRAFCVGFAVRHVGPNGGVLLGKLGADVLFYGLAIGLRERRRRRLAEKNRELAIEETRSGN